MVKLLGEYQRDNLFGLNKGYIADDKKFLKLNDIEAYKISFHLSNYVREVVLKWDYFARKTTGHNL